MHLTEIKIDNVRGFLDDEARTQISLPGGPGWHVFAGRNGAGKSSLLRAIALAIVGPDHARRLMPTFAGWIRKECEQASVRVKLVGDDQDAFRGGGTLPKGPISSELRWRAAGEDQEPEIGCSPVRNGKVQGPWRGPWSENPEGWLVAGYGPFRRLTGHGVDAQRSMSGAAHEGRLVTLFREDASLLEATSWLRELQFKRLEDDRAAGKLLDDVLELLNDDLLPDGARAVDVSSKGLWVKNRAGTVLEMRDLSDGYRVALALIIDILRHMAAAFGSVEIRAEKGKRKAVANAAVVLIDEADAHLHVSWQQRIGFWLTERFPNVQFLVTTHSPFTCQAAVPGGLFSLPAPGEARGIEAVSDDTYTKVVNGTVDQAVLSALFGMEHTRSPRARKLVSEYSELRAKLARAKLTTRETGRLKELERQLPLFSTGT